MGYGNFFFLHFEFEKKKKKFLFFFFFFRSFSFLKGFSIFHERVTHKGLDVMYLFNIVHILDVSFENMLGYGNVNTCY
jgi:hypothetical protein